MSYEHKNMVTFICMNKYRLKLLTNIFAYLIRWDKFKERIR